MGKWIALAWLLVGCATTGSPDHCGSHESFQRGLGDAEAGRLANMDFAQDCSSRQDVLRQYKKGYEFGILRRRQKLQETQVGPAPSQFKWVCEVEASRKVFTAMAFSQKEASHLAKATCSSHFQPSSCRQSECRKNL